MRNHESGKKQIKSETAAEVFGKRLRKLRQQAGLTGAELAEIVGTNQSRISAIETANNAYINALDLPLYAAALNTTVSFLVSGYEPENEFVGHELGLSNKTINRLIHDQQQGNIFYTDAINLFFDECDDPDSPFESAGETVLRLISSFVRCPEGKGLLEKVDFNNPLQYVTQDEIEQIRLINALSYLRRRSLRGEKSE